MRNIQIPLDLWRDIVIAVELGDRDPDYKARLARIRAGVRAKLDRMEAHDRYTQERRGRNV